MDILPTYLWYIKYLWIPIKNSSIDISRYFTDFSIFFGFQLIFIDISDILLTFYFSIIKIINFNYFIFTFCETKVWLISILMITKQVLELMIIFQVWLGKTVSKMVITKTNQVNEKSWRRRLHKKEVFSKNQVS